MSLCFVVINVPHLSRNFILYHHLFSAPSTTNSFVNQGHSPLTLFSNILLNIGNQIQTPYVWINQFLQSVIVWLHQLMRMTIEHSPANMGTYSFTIDPLHEDHAGNLLHLIIIHICWMAHVINRSLRTKENTSYLWLVVGLFAAFIWFMKWSPFHNRVQLLLFILWAPFLADIMIRTLRPKGVLVVGVILTVCALPWICNNYSRPLIGPKNVFVTDRFDQYFANLKGSSYSYAGVTQAIRSQDCHQVELGLSEDKWEYPLWVLLQYKNNKMRMEHVLGQTPSFKKSEYALGPFNPCAIIKDGEAKERAVFYGGKPYIKTLESDFLTVYTDITTLIKK